MKQLLSLAILLWASFASAKLANVEVYPLNYQTRFERTEEQQVNPRQALSFALGASRGDWGLLVEHSRFNTVSGTEFSTLIRSHQETLVWVRHEFRPLTQVFASLAAGGGHGVLPRAFDAR